MDHDIETLPLWDVRYCTSCGRPLDERDLLLCAACADRHRRQEQPAPH